MGDLISRKALMDALRGNVLIDVTSELENTISEQPTAFDLESVIAELEGNSKYMQSEANDLASVGDYGTATKLEGMAQAYKDCVNILKSAANATNGKIGG